MKKSFKFQQLNKIKYYIVLKKLIIKTQIIKKGWKKNLNNKLRIYKQH